MKAAISGTRNGVDWPRPGEVADLPDAEAADLVAAGLAVGSGPDVEVADLPDAGVETATAKRKRR